MTKKLYQFSYSEESNAYQYGNNSIAEIKVTGFPEDTDYSKWSMLHDKGNYRICFLKKNDCNTLYQGAYNSSEGEYQFGFNSEPEVNIQGLPSKANSSNFSMLHDGDSYRLYMID